MLEGSTITAVLGPTNTGKTHRAVEQMLSYDTGMIGLPLRLLAREVYDRVSTRVGEGRVALVTGEEKRVPRRPDYWVCTVEAMPMDREVDFLAVDEVQLAAHAQRGHVFTERLLAARGRRETWFLGADTMRAILTELVPTATVVSHARLSNLQFAGADKLSRLRARTAVVAFSVQQVTEVAERLRALHGGTAVVLGALSPRTRNAQVAMFQAGEVDHLVATDAIGMGLNLDVDHVAFASLRKFDGRDVRDLEPAELGQIAGRAGRYRNDGTFGTVAPLELPGEVVGAIEHHRFAPVRRLVWRNADLDFSSIEALVASLQVRPRARSLRLVEAPEDTAALVALGRSADVRALARGEEAVRLLWEVCTIPDFRKLLPASHAALLAELYAQLAGPRGRLEADWMAARIDEIDDPEGDVETLLARIAAIRTWTYVSHHPRWVADATTWQDRTRDIEDRLSDALHARLVQRYVERGKVARRRPGRARPRSSNGATERSAPAGNVAPAPSHPFARLAALRDALAPPEHPRGGPATDDRIEALVAATHDQLAVDAQGRVAFEGETVGQLIQGSRLLLPDAKLVGLTDLGAGAHARIQRRLVAVARDLVEELLAPLRSPSMRSRSPAARRLAYQLEQGLGTVLARDAAALLRALSPADRDALADEGVTVGSRAVFVPRLLEPAAVEQRLALCAAWYGRQHAPARPAPGAVSLPLDERVEAAAYVAAGFPVYGTRALRADVVERVRRALAGPERDAPDDATLAAWMGCEVHEVPWIASAIDAR